MMPSNNNKNNRLERIAPCKRSHRNIRHQHRPDVLFHMHFYYNYYYDYDD